MDELLFSGTLQLWSALAVGAVVLLYMYLTWTFDVFKKQGLNGPKPLPLFGNVLPFFRKPAVELYMEYRTAYGKVYGLFTARSPVLILGEPDLVKEVLIKEFNCFVNRTQFKNLQFKPLDRMMTVLCDDHWRHVRSRLSPAYSSGKLKQNVPTNEPTQDAATDLARYKTAAFLMLPNVKECVSHLIAHIDKHSGKEIQVKDVLSGYTMDVIAATAFGLDARSLDDPDNEFLKNAKRFFSFTNELNLKRIIALIVTLAVPRLAVVLNKLGFGAIDAEPVAYMEAVVKNALTNDKNVSEDRQNFVRLCLHELVDIKQVSADTIKAAASGGYWTTKGLTEEDVISNSIVFLLAGYDSVSSFLSYFSYAMATNLDAQRKVRDEIVQHLEHGEVTYDKLKDLQYLDMCMDEALRMYPPAVRIDRMCNKSVTIGRYYIPEGMSVNVPVYALHHDPEYWDDPFTFKPERFTPEEKAARHPCVYLPFGAGPRNCIGMRLALLEAKAAIVKLLSQFEVRTCSDTPKPPLKFGLNFGLLSPEKPIVLTFNRIVSTAGQT